MLPAWADFEAGQRAWDEGRPAEALEQWLQAADDEDRRAMLALGRLYEMGRGAPQNYILAHMWLNLAASRGEAEALAGRDDLAAKMTAEQIAVAQERATAWRPSGEDAAEAAPGDLAPEASATAPDAGEGQETASAAPPDEPAAPAVEESTAAEAPSPEMIRETQELLATLGYQPGPADGIWGRRSAQAYRSFLQDAAMPEADALGMAGLQALRAEAERREDSTEADAPPPVEPAEDAASAATLPVDSRPSAGEVIATVLNLAVQAFVAAQLLEMADDPERFARVAPELQALLNKMVAGFSSTDLADAGDGQISLGALSQAERGQLGELLQADRELPPQTRTALADALREAGTEHASAAPAGPPQPICTDRPGDNKCWIEIRDMAGCYSWQEQQIYSALEDDQDYDLRLTLPNILLSTTWSGGCEGGKASGNGKASWTWRHSEWGDLIGSWADGTYVNGKMHGRWVYDIQTFYAEGPFVEGTKHGRWMYRDNDYNFDDITAIFEGSYVNGRRAGKWTIRSPDFFDSEGEMVDGRKEGHWITRYWGGAVEQGSYVNGKKHGHWAQRDADGYCDFAEDYYHGESSGYVDCR